MSKANLSAPQFNDPDAAREALEAIRWPRGVFCPRCGTFDGITKMQGKSHRPGLFNCNGCRKPFSVTVGTVYERSHIPLHKWLLATHLMASSKKGISAHQLHRLLGITYKSAWFMAHRIREAMTGSTEPGPLGGKGKVVEADETFFGNLPPEKAPIRSNPNRPKFGPHHKRAIVSLVERGGKARSFYTVRAKADVVSKVVRENVAKESRLHTDESTLYTKVGAEFKAHEAVDHGRKEFVRGDVTTNTIESFFSVFKRGMRGIYQHCDEKHLHRYLAEFDFRYNNRAKLGVSDVERAEKALQGIEGKRLTYRRIGGQEATAVGNC
jgi:transposase-like protein